MNPDRIFLFIHEPFTLRGEEQQIPVFLEWFRSEHPEMPHLGRLSAVQIRSELARYTVERGLK